MQLQYNATADANGDATVTVRPSGTQPWRVDQVSVEMVRTDGAAVSGTATCLLRSNGGYVSPLVAQGDAAQGPPSITLGPTDYLTIEWAGANSGDICKATILYEVI